MKRYGVIVVGAGPAGSTAATVAAQAGARVLLIEEHTRIGHPIQCTGLLSARGWKFARIDNSVIVRGITGVRVHAPDGSVFELGGECLRAYVIERDRLDEKLVERAAQSGVEVRVGARATQLGPDRGGARSLWVQTPSGRRERFITPVVIGADGPHSLIAQQVGLPRPQKVLLGLQAVIEHQAERPGFVEVFFGRRWAANFFAWSVPAADGLARVGLATDRMHEAKTCFERLWAEYHRSGRILFYQSGMIPIGPAERTVADGVLLVGDAAGQAKPTSGGGLYTGMLCGRIAGEVAAHCALSGRTSARSLREYERRWRAKLERELSLGMRAHQVLTQLTDAQLNQVLRLLADPVLRKLIERMGDIDYPSKIARELLKHPRLWKKMMEGGVALLAA